VVRSAAITMSGMSDKAAGLKAAIEKSLNQLAQAVDEQRASEEMRRYLDVMARFHRYSWGNCLLISMARPDASLVGGFHHWKRLGRSVRKGERAIRILAPCPVEVENQDGDVEERVFFRTACVFDISQTEGRELPTCELPEVAVSAEGLLRRLERVAAKRAIALAYRPLDAGHYGRSLGGRIEVAEGHATGQQAKTLCHEIVHEMMHWGQDEPAGREAEELEAEAVAYVVCRHFGLDVELRASRYIALWDGDAKALGRSMERISRAARELIEDAESAGAGSDAPLPSPDLSADGASDVSRNPADVA